MSGCRFFAYGMPLGFAWKQHHDSRCCCAFVSSRLKKSSRGQNQNPETGAHDSKPVFTDLFRFSRSFHAWFTVFHGGFVPKTHWSAALGFRPMQPNKYISCVSGSWITACVLVHRLNPNPPFMRRKWEVGYAFAQPIPSLTQNCRAPEPLSPVYTLVFLWCHGRPCLHVPAVC